MVDVSLRRVFSHPMARRCPMAASVVSCLVAASGVSTPAAADRPLPLIVRQVAITANGARSTMVSSDETAAYCARFRLRPIDVRIYFAKAGRVDTQAYNHDLNMSRCHATGQVRFTDGRQGRWSIDRARRGIVTLTNGQPLYFYCVDCTAPSFDPLDEEDRENGRALIRAASAKR